MTKAKLEIRMSEAMDAVSSNARLGDVHNNKKQRERLTLKCQGNGIPKKVKKKGHLQRFQAA